MNIWKNMPNFGFDDTAKVAKTLRERQAELDAMLAQKNAENQAAMTAGRRAFQQDRDRVLSLLVATMAQHRQSGDWLDLAQFSNKWVALGYREALATELDALNIRLAPGWVEQYTPDMLKPMLAQVPLMDMKGWKAVVSGNSIRQTLTEIIASVVGLGMAAAMVAAMPPMLLVIIPDLLLAAAMIGHEAPKLHHVWLWVDANLKV